MSIECFLRPNLIDKENLTKKRPRNREKCRLDVIVLVFNSSIREVSSGRV